MANINKPLSQMTFSQAENLARQRNLTPSKYGATLAGTWTNQGLADALGVSIVKPSRSVYSSGQKVLATPTALKPPPTRADVLSQAQSLGDTTYGITQSPYNAATDVARTRYLNQVLPGKMTPLKAMAQGVGVTPEELNAAYLAGQQKGQQRDTTWTQTKAELDSRGAPDWFKVASALAGAHVGAQNLGSNIISDPAVHLSDAAKVGLSAYSGYKSPENISTKQILNIALPIPTLAEGGLVGYAGGGQYSATGIRPTPEQRPVVGALARMLQSADKFARKPFGYENPPVEAISDFLRVPELYRTMENYAYGSPLASGTSPVSRYLPRLSEDTKGAIEGAINLAPMVGPTMRATKATARAAAPYAARQALGMTEKYGVAPTMNVVKPTGNLNLQPILRQEILKGSDVQPVENFLAQAKATPGVTKDAFIELADRYSDLVPGTKLSKAEFESKIPPSQYSKVDLQNAAGGIEDDLMEQAYDIVNEDASGVFEMVLDRLGVPARQIPQGQYGNYINALQNYHLGDIGFDDLPAPLKRSMARQGIHDDQYAFGDLVQEQLDEAVYQTAQNLREYMDDDLVDAYRFVDVQRLLPASVRERLNEKNYFEVGVTHPHRADISYEHYPRYETGQDGLIGHFRGTMIPADVTDATAIVPGSTIKNPSVINLKPNSVIIEEIQSDAQKGAFSAEQTGALRQVHGTLFKAAVTEALERGARTVYFPTAQTIATVRSGDAKKYASIYDQQIVREGLKPLSKIPGVEIKPIEVNLTSVKGKTPPGSSVAYHEISFTDEAAEDILKGSGQQAPGYAEGGKFDLKEISDLAQKTLEKFTSLDTPQDMTTAETVADIAAGFVPGVGTAQSARDFERARREDDKLGMGLSALGMVPIVGGAVKPVRKVVDPWAEMYRKYFDKAPTNPSKSAEMRSIEEALTRTEKRAPTGNKRKIYDQVDWPERFYRGIKNATLGPNGEPLSDVSSLIMPQRGSEILAIQPNNPRNTAWAASNPLAAGNFAGYDPNLLIVPLRLIEKPDVVFNANAAPWDRFFSQTGQLNRFSSNYPLREDFKALMRDPSIRSILVKDIFDYNAVSPEALKRFSKLYGVSLKPEHLLSDNLLIKDPSVVQYLLTKETPKITETVKKNKSKSVLKKGDEYAAGGLVNYDPAEIDTIVSRIREELHG